VSRRDRAGTDSRTFGIGARVSLCDSLNRGLMRPIHFSLALRLFGPDSVADFLAAARWKRERRAKESPAIAGLSSGERRQWLTAVERLRD
jgi:hypothetical protein